MRMSVNGLDLHYLDWGNVGAPPVVCVHGYTSSAEAFNALARQFHDRFHIVAPDVRGHGESAWSPDGAYQYRDQVGDLAGLVDQLGLARFTLVGTSMGGIIAMAFAAAHAARLAGLVINDIGPDVEEGTQRITQTVGSRPDEFATLEAAMAYRREVSPVTASRPMSDQREVALGMLRQRVQHGAPPRPALWPVLRALSCPTVVVWGTESDVLSEAQAKRMAETLPRGELVTVPGVAHAPTLVEPVVLAALERFLGAQAVSRT